MNGNDPESRASRQGRVMRELTAVHRLSTTRLNRALRPLGLSLSQVIVMTRLLGPEGASVGELAAMMEINQPGVSKIVSALATLGAVEIGTDDDDGRRRVVSLTPTGMSLLVQARAAMHPEATAAFIDLDDAQLDTLHGLLATVRERLDPADRSAPASG